MFSSAGVIVVEEGTRWMDTLKPLLAPKTIAAAKDSGEVIIVEVNLHFFLFGLVACEWIPMSQKKKVYATGFAVK